MRIRTMAATFKERVFMERRSSGERTLEFSNALVSAGYESSLRATPVVIVEHYPNKPGIPMLRSEVLLFETIEVLDALGVLPVFVGSYSVPVSIRWHGAARGLYTRASIAIESTSTLLGLEVELECKHEGDYSQPNSVLRQRTVFQAESAEEAVGLVIALCEKANGMGFKWR